MQFEVRVARDGLEALELIQAHGADLAQLDLIMPRLDGARLCSFLKRQDRYKDVPVIIFSGVVIDEMGDIKSIGADAYVAKMPIEQVRETLKVVSETLLKGTRGPEPILAGFEKMYRREVVLELLQERINSRNLIDSLLEGVAVLSEKRRLLSANKAFQDLVGIHACALLSLPLEEIFPESGQELLKLSAGLRPEAPRASTIVQHAGRELQIKLHLVASSPQGLAPAEGLPTAANLGLAVERAARSSPQVQLQDMLHHAGYTLLIEDVTDKVKAERERELLRRQLAQTERMQAAGLLVSGVAHELNNPLAGVLGHSQLLMQIDTDERVRRGLETIHQEAERCRRIVQNLLTFARKHKPQKEYVGVSGILKNCVELRAYQLHVDSIQVAADLDPDLPKTMADFHQLEQVFLNIIINAHQAMNAQGKGGTLALRSFRDGESIVIEIEDTGPGIPPENLGRIFDPFFTTKEVGRGTGLGLSICYGIVEEHGGRLWARNSSRGGAMFIIELPIREPGPEEQMPSVRPDEPSREKTPPGRILLVDDEPVILDVLYQALRLEGHWVDTAPNDQVALRKIQDGAYDLIISDLTMPGMSGQQLFETVTGISPALARRIIFSTGDVACSETAEFLDRAGNKCIEKPFDLDLVRRVIAGMLASREPDSPS